MKKKATIVILTLALIVSFYNEIYSQEYYQFNKNRNLVIASNGLNIRSKPNTNSTKLVNVPYGETVQILHKDHYGLDTLYTIKSEIRDHPVYGYWQKVKYGEYIGFVHNAFLSLSNVYQGLIPEDVNVDFVYLRPGYDCSNKFYNSNDYIWYGYYQEITVRGEEAKKPYRKQISVEFINIADEMTGSGTIVKEDRHLRFIIGSKKIFLEGKMTNILDRILFERIENTNFHLDSTVLSQGYIIKEALDKKNYPDEEPNFFLCKGEKKQLINKRHENFQIYLNSYFVQSDLDGDGKEDFIFYLNYEGGSCGLYLSSEARADEVAKLVSLFRRGPCC